MRSQASHSDAAPKRYDESWLSPTFLEWHRCGTQTHLAVDLGGLWPANSRSLYSESVDRAPELSMSGDNEYALLMGAVPRRRSNPQANELPLLSTVIVLIIRVHSVVFEHPTQLDSKVDPPFPQLRRDLAQELWSEAPRRYLRPAAMKGYKKSGELSHLVNCIIVLWRAEFLLRTQTISYTLHVSKMCGSHRSREMITTFVGDCISPIAHFPRR